MRNIDDAKLTDAQRAQVLNIVDEIKMGIETATLVEVRDYNATNDKRDKFVMIAEIPGTGITLHVTKR